MRVNIVQRVATPGSEGMTETPSLRQHPCIPNRPNRPIGASMAHAVAFLDLARLWAAVRAQPITQRHTANKASRSAVRVTGSTCVGSSFSRARCCRRRISR